MANKFDDLLNQGGSQNTTSTGGASSTVSQPVPPLTNHDSSDETYTEEEQRDVNAITVTVPDTSTPIVVLFGSPASGKTLALMRMIRFLESHEHQVIPEEVFRPKTDKHYTRMCENLKNMVYSNYTPGGTDIISFMLVKVLNPVGQPVCQILEAPGEHYFDGSPNLEFPTYINHITTLPNRKVWVFFVEQDWGENQGERNLYAQKIRAMQGIISPNDKVVFLFNKADRQRTKGQYDKVGHPKAKLFFKNIQQQYPDIFTNYKNSGLTAILYGDYNFKVVCFSSGIFNKTNDGREVWTLSPDFYCHDLWKAIM